MRSLLLVGLVGVFTSSVGPHVGVPPASAQSQPTVAPSDWVNAQRDYHFSLVGRSADRGPSQRADHTVDQDQGVLARRTGLQPVSGLPPLWPAPKAAVTYPIRPVGSSDPSKLGRSWTAGAGQLQSQQDSSSQQWDSSPIRSRRAQLGRPVVQPDSGSVTSPKLPSASLGSWTSQREGPLVLDPDKARYERAAAVAAQRRRRIAARRWMGISAARPTYSPVPYIGPQRQQQPPVAVRQYDPAVLLPSDPTQPSGQTRPAEQPQPPASGIRRDPLYGMAPPMR